jgi:hypothetical protein
LHPGGPRSYPHLLLPAAVKLLLRPYILAISRHLVIFSPIPSGFTSSARYRGAV